MGPDGRRSRASECRQGAAGGGDAGHELRRADAPRVGAREARHEGLPVDRGHPHGQLGHGGDDERAAPGPRLHGTRQDRQVHRLLSRSQRQPARQRRLGHGDVRRAELAGRHEGHGSGHDLGALQRCRGHHEGHGRDGRRDRSGHHRAGRGQHGLRAAEAGLSAQDPRAHAGARHDPDLR